MLTEVSMPHRSLCGRPTHAYTSQGAKFQRRKMTFGMSLSGILGTEEVVLKLNEANRVLRWYTPASSTESKQNSGEIDLSVVKAIDFKAPKSLSITSNNGDMLLEAEAEEAAVARAWIEALCEECGIDRKAGEDEPAKPSSLKNRAAKQVSPAVCCGSA